MCKPTTYGIRLGAVKNPNEQGFNQELEPEEAIHLLSATAGAVA
jgi:hypothetical protein